MNSSFKSLLVHWLTHGNDVERRHAEYRLGMEYPSLFQQTTNLGHAVGSVVTSAVRGEPITVSQEEQARRLAICHACATYDPVGDRCRGCGCFLSLKTRIATQHCPLDPPKW